jgi:hypothetical protein
MYKEIGVKSEKEKQHDHVKKPVTTSLESTLTIFWNQAVRTA